MTMTNRRETSMSMLMSLNKRTEERNRI